MWKYYDRQAGSVDGDSVHVVTGVCSVADGDKDEERAGGCRGRGISDAREFSLRWDFSCRTASSAIGTDSREQSFISLTTSIADRSFLPNSNCCFPLDAALSLDFINTFY